MLDCVSMQKHEYDVTMPKMCNLSKPLGIQVYFNAKIIFCSSDQRDEALFISGKLNYIVSFCFLSSVLQFIQIQFSNFNN